MSRSTAGFTLMEAIVALGVFALVVVAAQRGFASGSQAIRAAHQEARAVALAQSLLASAGNDTPLVDGAQAEGVQAGMAWDVRVSKYEEPEGSEPPPGAGLYWVDTDVRWRNTALAPLKAVHLKTVKRGAAP